MPVCPATPGERFAQSLSDVLGCGFENVTVHTLSIKNASPIRFSDESVYDAEGVFARACVDYAYERLSGEGYAPIISTARRIPSATRKIRAILKSARRVYIIY